MKVLLDHNVPRRLRLSLNEHIVITAAEAGWAEISNGRLLDSAERAGFQIMITADQNLFYQQNLRGRNLALIVLSTNHWTVVKQHIPAILRAIDAANPGSFARVEI